jgi:transcriptional regulator with GAF, ATPase, and Fis domain
MENQTSKTSREVLGVLIPHLIKKLQVEAVLSNEAFRSLRYCDFGGNIRELKNVLQRAVIEYEVQGGKLQLGKPRVLEIKHFQFIKGMPTCRGPRNEDEQSEYEQIIRLLDETNGNQSEAAKKMNMAMSTFNDRVRKYGLNLKSRSF